MRALIWCQMDLNALNSMDAESFTAVLGGVFENSPWVAQGAWNARPFDTVASLHAAMMLIVDSASPAQQLALLCAHPELAGREARAGEMTEASQAEQAGAGLDRLSAAEMTRISELNRAYGTKFGHPFIIAVRNNSKQDIFEAFERRLANDAAAERITALTQVSIIARLRLDAKFAPCAGQGT
jgi:2-oxo-4-hydroxy-4-carboxy-5-ureidoimidazoline decarboxylase